MINTWAAIDTNNFFLRYWGLVKQEPTLLKSLSHKQ